MKKEVDGFCYTTAIKKLRTLSKRIRVVPGGTSAGKTYGIIPILIDTAIKKAGLEISIVSESIPHLRRGANKDFLKIMKSTGRFIEANYNKTLLTYTFSNGSYIEFFSADQEDKVRGPRRNIIYINERNNITFETYHQLAIRTDQVIWLDFNPANEFWVHTELMDDKDVDWLTLTYKDNEALTQSIVYEIEKAKTKAYYNPDLKPPALFDAKNIKNHYWNNWWKVYGLGELGILEGVIFKNWYKVKEVPEGARCLGYGIDFGFSCFSEDTLVTTINGDKHIKDILVGDLVLTRLGYRPVKKVFYNGIKKTITKKINIAGRSIEITATYNHNFNANGKWKKYGKLMKKDKLFVLLPLKGMSIEDTQTENTQDIIITNVKRMGNTTQNCCIMQYMRSISEKLKMVILSIILTMTRLTTKSKTLCRCLYRNMHECIKYCVITYKITGKNIEKNTDTEKIIGQKEEKRRLSNYNQKQGHVINVVLNILRLMFIKDFVQKNVMCIGKSIQMKMMKLGLVGFVKMLFQQINIQKQLHVQANALIQSRSIKEITIIKKSRERVYDLCIDGVYEYFANGILVHNCDPTAIVACYQYQGVKIWKELIYQTGMTNGDIAKKMIELGITKNDTVIADCSEPKSIAEINEFGFNVRPAVKGPDSIKFGIDVLQEEDIYVTEDSLNLIKELRTYSWDQDKTGKLLNKPVDAFCHLIDAMRYLATGTMSKQKSRKRGIKSGNPE